MKKPTRRQRILSAVDRMCAALDGIAHNVKYSDHERRRIVRWVLQLHFGLHGTKELNRFLDSLKESE